MSLSSSCPVCRGNRAVTSVSRHAIPLFQNVVYDSAEEARAAPSGDFLLATCTACGFSWNCRFDASRIVYDPRYDNHVESRAFTDYYRQIASMLIARFGLVDGTVYDVGCGKGEFLEILCGMAPGIRGVGIDPSCTPREAGNLKLVRSRFEPGHFEADCRLVICRHVLEHIDTPVGFLEALRQSMPDVPLYVEVPDLDWIIDQGAFWDFCYEHCNYFTPGTLARAVDAAGFQLVEQANAFEDQYQWVVARPGQDRMQPPVGALHTARPPGDATALATARIEAYATREAAAIERMRALALEHGGLVVWGMATKGVMLSMLLGVDHVVGGIDMNPAKQGRFAAGSGVGIQPPEWLRTVNLAHPVMVMNANYLDEIRAIAVTHGLDRAIHAPGAA